MTTQIFYCSYCTTWTFLVPLMWTSTIHCMQRSICIPTCINRYTYCYIISDVDYSEIAWVGAKWQWHARDCVTGLHDRRICLIALMNLGETCHLKRRDFVTVWRTMLLLCCYHCDCMQQQYDFTRFKCVLWRHTMHNGLWIFITKHESPKGDS